MSTLILAFANSKTNPLASLTEEYEGVTDALTNRQANKDFVMIADRNLDRPKMIKDIRANEKDICLFLFSGHADGEKLILEDGDGRAEGIAALLGRCPALKLVFLNGCSTKGQVDRLLEQNIPIVIATSAPIGDKKATKFSIAFFTELAKGQSIQEAFDRGLGQANVFDKIQETTPGSRNIGSTQDDATNDPLWGIYYNPENKALLDTWRLPVNERTVNTQKINQDITRVLEYIAEKYKLPPNIDTVLVRLPFFISEPIRTLFATRVDSQDASQFYDTPSWERFQRILYAYQAIINLTTYTLLAELWDKKSGDPRRLALSEPCRTLIKEALFNNRTNDKTYSNLSLLKTLMKTWIEAGETSFLSEIKELNDILDKDLAKKAIADLESKITDQGRLERIRNSEFDLLRLCQETEKNYAYILFAFGFWVNYDLLSIKNIELVKFRQQTASYIHQIIPLQTSLTGPTQGNNNQVATTQPLDTSSIMLQRRKNLPEDGPSLLPDSLNLSPFLIDKNALTKAPKVDLHYLLSFSPQRNFFCYQKATAYNDQWSIQPERNVIDEEEAFFGREKKEKTAEASFYTLLNAQCDSFCQTVLNQSLSEL